MISKKADTTRKLYEHLRIWQAVQRAQVVDHINPTDIANLAHYLEQYGWRLTGKDERPGSKDKRR